MSYRRAMISIRRRTVRLWVTTVGLAVVPFASAAFAQTIPQRDISRPPEVSSCPGEDPGGSSGTGVPEDGFADVPTTNVHEYAIDCLVWYGLAAGTSTSTYDPGSSVRRDQMASFIARLVDYAADADHAGSVGPGEALPPPPMENQFPCDVDVTNVHYDAIQRLAAANIVEGTGTDSSGRACYGPDGSVTRAQAATFVHDAQVYITNIIHDLDGADYFVDDSGNNHENNINVLAALGIARGTGNDTDGRLLYSPERDVQRDQMASFLARLLDFLVEEGEITPPATSE